MGRMCVIACCLLGTVLFTSCEALKPVVTLAEYNAVHEGMSYQQVVEIVGAPGTEISRTYVPGVAGMMNSVTMVTFTWQNTDGSNMVAMFDKDRLTTKAQYGLR